jgi:hypothetical protein
MLDERFNDGLTNIETQMSTFLGMISQEEKILERILSFTRHNLFTEIGE